MKSPTVVIVEDEFLVALQIEDILLDQGCSVIATVPDLAAADRVTQPADVALVDLNLRDGPTGAEIAKRLSDRFGTRIIYVTANAAQIGSPVETAVGVVNKPFSKETIEAAVAFALDDTKMTARPCDLHDVPALSLKQVA